MSTSVQQGHHVVEAGIALDAQAPVPVAGLLPDRAPGQGELLRARHHLTSRTGAQEDHAEILQEAVGGEEHAARIGPDQVQLPASRDDGERVVEFVQGGQSPKAQAREVLRGAQPDIDVPAMRPHPQRRECLHLHRCRPG